MSNQNSKTYFFHHQRCAVARKLDYLPNEPRVCVRCQDYANCIAPETSLD